MDVIFSLIKRPVERFFPVPFVSQFEQHWRCEPRKKSRAFHFHGPGFDFLQTIILFLSSKASFHACGSFFAKNRSYCFSLILVFACTSFSFKPMHNMMISTPAAVCIGRIDVITTHMTDLPNQIPSLTN